MSAVGKIDWAKLATKLKPETMAQVNAFRSRHVALLKQVAELKEQENGIKFDNYKSLKNQAVVSEAKKALESFQPAKFDLTKQLEVIESAKKEDVKKVI
jgi:F-type H+-transporting ATPase subunit d